MARTLTKQTQSDFRSRVKRVDPRFHRMGAQAYSKDRTPRRRTPSLLMGFAWIYMVASVANNRDTIATSLKQGSLPAQYHDWIFAGLTVLLAASAVMIGLHLVRYLFKDGNKKKNSGAVLFGGLGALMLFYTPASVWTQGYGMLDTHSQSVLMQASAALEGRFPDLKVDEVAFVTSTGR